MKATDNFINQAGERAAQIAPKITVPSNPDQTFASVAVNVAQQVCALLETTGWDGDVKIPGVDAWVARNASNQLFFLDGFHIPNDSLNSPCSPAEAENWIRLWVEYWAPETTPINVCVTVPTDASQREREQLAAVVTGFEAGGIEVWSDGEAELEYPSNLGGYQFWGPGVFAGRIIEGSCSGTFQGYTETAFESHLAELRDEERSNTAADAPATTLTIWGDGSCPELDRFNGGEFIESCEPPEQALAWWETALEPWCVSITIIDKAQEDDLVAICDRTPAVEGYCFD